jgi:5-(carboxyamino)imidazole ribonucleotide mutase
MERGEERRGRGEGRFPHLLRSSAPLLLCSSAVGRIPPMTSREKPLVAILMGSKSDWETMRHAGETLARFGVASESRVLSAHRSPDALADFVRTAEDRGIEVLIAGAGGAAHLAGAVAANTILPVLGVPIDSSALKGLDALLATVQMPAGVPVATFAIGKAGVINAALQAVAILAGSRPDLKEKLKTFRREQAAKILSEKLE